MSRPRVLAAAVSAALVLAVGGVLAPVALAAPVPAPAPVSVPADRPVAAQQRVDAAEQGVTSQLALAEAATEDYDAAQSRAEAAADASTAAAAAAGQARAGAAGTQQQADLARADADAAAVRSRQATQDSQRALQAVDAAQQSLDGLVAGAYRSGGTLGMMSALVGSDPATYATGRALINQAGQFQKDRLDTLGAARRTADAAAGQAAAADAAAQGQSQAASARADEAVRAASAATATEISAAQASATARSAAFQAAAQRDLARALVAAAENELGTAKVTAAALTAMAEQARRDGEAARLLLPAIAPAAGSAPAAVIAAAYGALGTPYAWGGGSVGGATHGIDYGAGTVGFDCSGLTLYAYAKAGIRLPHSSRAQYTAGTRVPSVGALLPGDLVFFAYDTADPGTIHHVAIYLGGGRMLGAPHTGDVVKVSTLYSTGFIGGVRLTS